MFNIKPLVEPVITDVEATQQAYLVGFVLEALRTFHLPWEEVFFNVVSGFTIPSLLNPGEMENIAVFDLRCIGEDVLIFSRCNSDWSEYITHYQYDYASKSWLRLSTTYSLDNEDFDYLAKLSKLYLN